MQHEVVMLCTAKYVLFHVKSCSSEALWVVLAKSQPYGTAVDLKLGDSLSDSLGATCYSVVFWCLIKHIFRASWPHLSLDVQILFMRDVKRLFSVLSEIDEAQMCDFSSFVKVCCTTRCQVCNFNIIFSWIITCHFCTMSFSQQVLWFLVDVWSHFSSSSHRPSDVTCRSSYLDLMH